MRDAGARHPGFPGRRAFRPGGPDRKSLHETAMVLPLDWSVRPGQTVRGPVIPDPGPRGVDRGPSCIFAGARGLQSSVDLTRAERERGCLLADDSRSGGPAA